MFDCLNEIFLNKKNSKIWNEFACHNWCKKILSSGMIQATLFSFYNLNYSLLS